MVSDNGGQFSGVRLRKFCEDHEIEQCFTLVGHSQANEEVEIANRTLLQGLKAGLDQTEGSWIEELYHVLWAYHIMQRVPTSEMPFNLAFRIEAIITVKFRLSSFRIEEYDKDTNSVWL